MIRGREARAAWWLLLLLGARAQCGRLWRVGLISRTRAFRWDMDAALGEWTWS